MKTRFLPLMILLLPVAAVANPVEWTVDVAGSGPEVSPTMHGIFFEDINYAGDGGLYAELVENRSFEHRSGMHGWSVEKLGGANGSHELADSAPIHPNNPRYLSLNVTSAGDGYGVSNPGYGGIPVNAGAGYRFAVHARAAGPYAGELKICIQGADGTKLAEAEITGLASSWQRHSLKLTTKSTDPNARLVVLATAPGKVDIDVVSLFPENTWKGRENGMRADLVQLLADMKPGFMRFPGGCIVEGNDLANAYRWKDTVGDISVRKQNWNRWIHDDAKRPDHHYHQTYGLGLFEFFQLCEDIGAEPVPVINCGMSCQFQAKQLVPLDELGPWVQDAIDLIEFANGPVTTKWGKLRAEMGHPAPFGMKQLGVGNEQWGEEYFKRYDVFYRALKAKHPEITLITTSGPGVDDAHWKLAWDKFRNGTPAEVVDEHYYRPPSWFLDHAARYDSYDRKGPKVFAGEFAAHRKDKASTLDAAICEAAFMTGLLRNADVVTMSCFAPLLAREGFTQWTPDLVWFDATRVMATPSYHVQAIFGRNRPDRILPSFFKNNTATSDAKGKVGVGTWQTQADFKDIVVSDGENILFRSKDAMEGWDRASGQWMGNGGVLSQSANDKGAVILAGDPSWMDYTLSLKARKTGGSEGFLILFHTLDENTRCWWNIGGWGNTGHALEINGKEHPRVAGTIETNRWYDICVEARGGEILCYLDNKLIHQIKTQARSKVYAVAGSDRANGEIILHASNPSSLPQDVLIDLRGVSSAKDARGQVLKSASPDDRNTLAMPDKVATEELLVPVSGASIRCVLPAWSHTVLRVPH